MEHLKLAPTPPLGWNSWDCYGATVREEEIRGNAEYMAKNLKQYGWEYVVVDIQWYEPTAVSSAYNKFVPLEMDEFSRVIPAVNRFPSAADGNGFKSLADYVHSLGLKFGIHFMRGIPRQAAHANTAIKGTEVRAREIAHPNSICPWNTDMYGVDTSKEGAQEYYNSLFELYASWGVDFVKVDDIAASTLYGIHDSEIRMIRKAINNCGRDMILSLSPGPAPLEFDSLLHENANMWRMTDDYWDIWEHLYVMFERCEKWIEHSRNRKGSWPDCDMLPLGHIGIRSVDGGGKDRWTRFTKEEQITMMTLWSIFKSPMMFGGDMRDNDDWTLSLLTNTEVMNINQNSSQNRMVYRKDEKVAWTAKDSEGNTVVALFNLNNEEAGVSLSLDELELEGTFKVRNIWERTECGEVTKEISYKLPAHGALFLKIYQ